MLLRWVKEAWENLDDEIIVRSFKKTGISNEMDGTEDDALWDDSDDDEGELEFPGFDSSELETASALQDNRRFDGTDDEGPTSDEDSYMTDDD